MTVVETMGWVLVHFLWQGAVIAGLLWLVLTLASPARAALRYALGCSALALMLLAPIVTARMLVGAGGASQAPAIAAAAAADTRLPTLDSDRGDTTSRQFESRTTGRRPKAQSEPQPAGSSDHRWIGERWARALVPAMRAAVADALPWFVAAWAVGVLLLSVRLAGGWWRMRALRTRGIAPVPPACQQAAARLVARMRIARPVELLVSARVMAPIVFGHVKPVVLVPASVLSGLTPSQLDAILAHELAHVRRCDYLVNLLQTVIETVLFYHPAVWWVSRQVRVAREDCCDDIAVAACGDRKGYVEALLGLEQLRHASATLALGATDGSLLTRARRILTDAEREGSSPRLTASVIAVAVAALAMAGISTAATEPVAMKTSIAASPEPIAPATGTTGTTETTEATGAPASAQPQTVKVAPDPAAPLAARRAWVEREARAQGARRYWLGYAIRPVKGLPPLVYLDRHGLIMGDRMQFSGHFMSQRAEGFRFPGQPLAIADADPSAIKILFAFDASGGSPRLAQVHASTLPLPVAVNDLPVFWIGSAETAPSLALIDGLYGAASIADVKKDLVAAVAVHDDSPAVVAWLDRRVRSGDPDEIREEAAEGLAWHPIPAALTALDRTARQDRASRVRQEAAEALGDLALPEATPALIALAKSLDDLDARREAVEALGARPDPAATNALGAIARQDANVDIQREAVETLGDYKDQRGVPLLIDLLRTHPRPDVRREVVETLGDAMAGESVVALLQQVALEDVDPGVQEEAVETLGDLDRDDARAAVRGLVRSHPRGQVRRKAVEALAQAGHRVSADTPAAGTEAARQRAETVKFLSDLIDNDADPDVQREAVESLGEMKDPQALERLRIVARTHAQSSLRREAVEALIEHAPPAAALALLRDIIQQDADMDVRREAVERLAELQDPAARTSLIELARTHAIEDIRAEAVESLGDAPHAADTVQVLKQIANDDRSLRVRVEALETLADLADGAGVTALIEVAREHQDFETRKQAIEALVESDHPRAREIFDRALKPSGR